MQDMTREKIIADFQITGSEEEVQAAIQETILSVTNLAMVRIQRILQERELIDDYNAFVEVHGQDSEQSYRWFTERGIDVDAVFREAYAEAVEHFQMLGE